MAVTLLPIFFPSPRSLLKGGGGHFAIPFRRHRSDFFSSDKPVNAFFVFMSSTEKAEVSGKEKRHRGDSGCSDSDRGEAEPTTQGKAQAYIINSLEGLPSDLVLQVGSFLKPAEVVTKLAGTNKHFNKMLKVEYPKWLDNHRELPMVVRHLDRKEAERCKQLAEQGDPVGMARLGMYYEYGRGVVLDDKKSDEYLKQSIDKGLEKKAVEQGDPVGLFALGMGYWVARAVAKDYVKALDYSKRALAKGLEKRWPVCTHIGFLYFNGGPGLQQDYKEENKWYKKSVNEDWGGAAESSFNLGISYQYGQGVNKDLTEARKWYKKSAEYGTDADGLRQYGLYLLKGLGGPADEAKGFRLLLQARAMGDDEATEVIGQLAAYAGDKI